VTKAATREVKVTAVQSGERCEDKEKNVANMLAKIDEAAQDKPDFIVFPELSTTPYFGIDRDPRYFEWAEPVPGPATEAVAEKAKEYECCILVPLFEKGPIEGVYYNSVAVLGPDGALIEGELKSGGKRKTFSKVHVPEVQVETLRVDEKFYFRSGEGIPIFKTPKATIGILVCFDRRFPEAWRSLALQGAEIAFLPANVPAWVPTDLPETEAVAKAAASSGEMFTSELRTRALENLFFVVAANIGAYETLAGVKSLFFGMSCVINPSGGVIAQAPANEPAIISATLDLDEVTRTRRALPLYKDRKPEVYVVD
jgi:predicted amidohydrolase